MAAAEPIADVLALKLQELQHLQPEPRPLLRIDNRREAAGAPFQFDTVVGFRLPMRARLTSWGKALLGDAV